MGNFGLGLVLSFSDKASVGIGRVTNTISQLESAARKASSVIDSLGNSINALGSIGASMSATITAPISLAMKSLTSIGMSSSSALQNTYQSFRSILGDADKASAFMDRIENFAKNTPYSLSQLSSTVNTLLSGGISASRVLDSSNNGLLSGLMNWAGANGKNLNDIQNVATTLSNIKAMGKVTNTELRNLTKNGINVSQMIADTYGYSASQVDKMIKKGTIDASNMVAIISNKLNTEYVGGIDRLTQTWEGAQSRFNSVLERSALKLFGEYIDENGEKRFKFLDSMTKALNNLSDAIENVSDLLQPLMDVVENTIVKASEWIKSVSESFASFDDETKKHIGSFIATITLMGPALILFSKVGGLVLETIGFFKTFATSMGGVTLILTTLFFLIATNFNNMGLSVSETIDRILECISTAIMLVNGSVDDLKKKWKELENDDSFFSNLTKGITKVVAFIKILADAWSDNTISEETYQKMQELGLASLVEGVLTFKDRFTYFLQGFKQGMIDIVERVKAFFGGLQDSFKGTFLETAINKLTQLFDTLRKGSREDFYEMGKTFANIFTGFIGLRTALPIAERLFSVFSKGGSVISNIFGGKSKRGGLLGNFFKNLKEGYTAERNNFLKNDLPIMRDSALAEALNTTTDMALDAVLSDSNVRLSDDLTGQDMLESMWESLENGGDGSASEFIAENFGEVLEEGVDNALEKVVPPENWIVNLFQHPLQSLKGMFSGLVNFITGGISKIVTFLTSPLGIILAIITALGVMYATNEDFRNSVNELLGTVFNLLKEVWGALQPIVEAVMNVIKIILPILSGLLQTVAEVLAPIISFVAQLVNVLLPLIKPLIEVITLPLQLIAKLINTIADSTLNLGEVFKGVFSVISGVFQSIVAVVFDPIIMMINAIISGINTIKDKLSDTWLGKKLGIQAKPIETLDYIIPHFAEGGLISKPTIAEIGEDGTEAVVPLENNTDWVNRLADSIVSRAKQDNVNNVYNSGYTVDGSLSTNITINASENSNGASKSVAKQMAEMYRNLEVTLQSSPRLNNKYGDTFLDFVRTTRKAFETLSV